jgi:type I restriction-modification system DNA methylase subunit
MANRKNSEKTNGNGANLGFEAKLWLAADKLRGHMDAAEYKHVVLGLIFLKYISDAFQEHYEALKSEPEANPEDRDEYTAKNVFWVPKKARWSGPSGLQANAKQPTIGKLIDDAMVAIEKGAGKYADVPGFCKSATTEEITGHGFVLTPGRYVGAEEIEDDGESFDEKMQRLTTTLFEQFSESARLEKAIRKNLKGLGYGG